MGRGSRFSVGQCELGLWGDPEVVTRIGVGEGELGTQLGAILNVQQRSLVLTPEVAGR